MFCINWNRQCAFFNFRFWIEQRHRLNGGELEGCDISKLKFEAEKMWKAINVVEAFWWKSLKMICLHNKHFYVQQQQLHSSPDEAQQFFISSTFVWETKWRKFIVQFLMHSFEWLFCNFFKLFFSTNYSDIFVPHLR